VEPLQEGIDALTAKQRAMFVAGGGDALEAGAYTRQLSSST